MAQNKQITEVIDKNDLQNIAKLEKEAFCNYVNYWSVESFEDINNKSDRYIFKVLRIDQNIIGYLIFLIVDKEAELLKIAISKDYQKQGLSKYFINNQLLALKQLGINKVILEVMIDNNSAILLYNSLGFNKIGIRKNYYKLRSNLNENNILKDAIVMELKI